MYELSVSNNRYNNYPVLKHCFFGTVKSTKNADINKYNYSRYGIGFDRRVIFPFFSGGFG